jgi:hypothetical protein
MMGFNEKIQRANGRRSARSFLVVFAILVQIMDHNYHDLMHGFLFLPWVIGDRENYTLLMAGNHTAAGDGHLIVPPTFLCTNWSSVSETG